MYYVSTRGEGIKKTSQEAILKGLADDGGLYVPVEIPKLKKSWNELKNYSYKDISQEILSVYFDDFKEDELKEIVDISYRDKFLNDNIVEIKKCGNDYFLELFHGKTLAFKDMALSLMPNMMEFVLKKIQKKGIILVATSGDTGKAALEGFSAREKIDIAVFYPNEGISEIQRKQMVTQEGDNVKVIGVKGNFDDAQTGLKKAFLKYKNSNLEDVIISSANSINIGRLLPQVIYYYYSYIELLRRREIWEGERINIVVPTGNFGNILAGYYAKLMGLPIKKIICASNENDVLKDFFDTGTYDVERDFKQTLSPSMDILVSSNLERLLYHVEKNGEKIKAKMESLKEKNKFEISDFLKSNINEFEAERISDEETSKYIKKVYDIFEYVIDPHTAVAYGALEKYKVKTADTTKTIIVSTASPFKFPKTVASALGINLKEKSDWDYVDCICEKFQLEMPNVIKKIREVEVIHNDLIEKSEIEYMVDEIIKGSVGK